MLKLTEYQWEILHSLGKNERNAQRNKKTWAPIAAFIHQAVIKKKGFTHRKNSSTYTALTRLVSVGLLSKDKKESRYRLALAARFLLQNFYYDSYRKKFCLRGCANVA